MSKISVQQRFEILHLLYLNLQSYIKIHYLNTHSAFRLCYAFVYYKDIRKLMSRLVLSNLRRHSSSFANIQFNFNGHEQLTTNKYKQHYLRCVAYTQMIGSNNVKCLLLN